MKELTRTVSSLSNDSLVEELIEEAWRQRHRDIDHATELVDCALSLLDQKESVAGIKQVDRTKSRRARAHVVHSFILRCQDNYPQSLIHSLDVIEILNNASDLLWVARAYGNIGGLFLHLGLRSEAIDYLIRQLEIGKSLGDVELELTAYHNLGMVYMASANYAIASSYFEKAIPCIDPQNDTAIYSYGVSNLAQCQIHLGEYEKARLALEDCLSLCKSTKARHAESVILRVQGALEEALGDYKAAMRLYGKSSEINHEHGNLYTGILLNLGLSRCNLYLESPEAALKALTCALNDSISIGERTLTYQSHELLADAYRAVGDVEQAFHHFQEFHTIKESVWNIRSEQKIEQMKILSENRTLNSGPSSSLPDIPNYRKNSTPEVYQATNNPNLGLINHIEAAAHEIRSQLTIVNIYNSLLKSSPSSLSQQQRENAHNKIGKAIDTISRQLVDQSAYIEQNRS